MLFENEKDETKKMEVQLFWINRITLTLGFLIIGLFLITYGKVDVLSEKARNILFGWIGFILIILWFSLKEIEKLIMEQLEVANKDKFPFLTDVMKIEMEDWKEYDELNVNDFCKVRYKPSYKIFSYIKGIEGERFFRENERQLKKINFRINDKSHKVSSTNKDDNWILYSKTHMIYMASVLTTAIMQNPCYKKRFLAEDGFEVEKKINIIYTEIVLKRFIHAYEPWIKCKIDIDTLEYYGLIRDIYGSREKETYRYMYKFLEKWL